MEVGRDAAPYTATHPLSATAHGRVAGSISPPEPFMAASEHMYMLLSMFSGYQQ